MHFQTVTAVLALSASGALAQLVPTDSVGFSVLSVLATAIPAESQSAALANPSSFAAAVASSISAGNLPAWYTGLPADVKSILPSLYPVTTSAVPVTTASSTPAPSSSASVGTISASSNSTGGSTFVSPTLSPTSLGGAESSATGSPSSTSASGNGAAVPTAVFGAGIAGAIGMLGMLAL